MSVNLYNATTDTLKNVAGDIINTRSVNEMVAPVEERITASRAYSVGEQFIIDNVLCYAMTNIAQGEEFDYDVNYYESSPLAEQVDDKQNKTDNSLTTTSKTVVGAINEVNSGKQNKLTNPLTQADVVDNLTSTSTVLPLSAKQGKALNDKFASYQPLLTNPITQSDVINNLTSTSTVKPLSAYQGKVINDKIHSDAHGVGVKNSYAQLSGGQGSDGNVYVLAGTADNTKYINLFLDGTNVFCQSMWNGTSKIIQLSDYDYVRSWSPTLSSKIEFTAGTPCRTNEVIYFYFCIHVKSGQTIAANETLFTLPVNTKGWFTLPAVIGGTSGGGIICNGNKVYTETQISGGTYINVYGCAPIFP